MSSQGSEPKKSRFSLRRRGGDSAKPKRQNQLLQVYKQTKQYDAALPWWMALTFLLTLAVFILLGVWWGGFFRFVMVLFGVMFGVLAMMIVLGRRAEAAAYKSIAGTPGASGAALGSLRRGWNYSQEPVAADANRARGVKEISNAAMVFRAVGRPGVVLIGEGPKGAAAKLLESERKRVVRVAGPEVPVHVMRVGAGDDATSIDAVTKTMKKYPKKLTNAEVDAVTKRLDALGASKPPLPQGVDPRRAPRMDRKAMRGR